jgi:hypothetical protein
MTLPEHTTNSPSLGNPIGMGKSATDDGHDAHDDELQRFSKGSAALSFADERSSLDNDRVGAVRETTQPAHTSLWLRPDTAPKGEQVE